MTVQQYNRRAGEMPCNFVYDIIPDEITELHYQRTTSGLIKAACRPVASWGRKSYDLQISLTPTVRDNVVYNNCGRIAESTLNAHTVMRHACILRKHLKQSRKSRP